jgi:hypothetical protein
MLNNNVSPLESLASFAIAFATGIVSTVIISKCVEKVRNDALRSAASA